MLKIRNLQKQQNLIQKNNLKGKFLKRKHVLQLEGKKINFQLMHIFPCKSEVNLSNKTIKSVFETEEELLTFKSNLSFPALIE